MTNCRIIAYNSLAMRSVGLPVGAVSDERTIGEQIIETSFVTDHFGFPGQRVRYRADGLMVAATVTDSTGSWV